MGKSVKSLNKELVKLDKDLVKLDKEIEKARKAKKNFDISVFNLRKEAVLNRIKELKSELVLAEAREKIKNKEKGKK